MKLAHIHRPKCMGVFVNSWFRNKVFEPNGWRLENSWQSMFRDWTPAELSNRLIADDEHHFVHNHAKKWTKEHVELARRKGFTTFSWSRHPGDLLCSYFYFHMKEFKHVGNDYAKLGIPIKDFHLWPLDNWLRHVLDDDDCQCELHLISNTVASAYATDGWLDWETPPWIDEVEVYMPFSDQNFQWFLRQHCNTPYKHWPKRNTSCNAGWKNYCDQGVISAKTQALLFEHPEWERWIKLTEKHPID